MKASARSIVLLILALSIAIPARAQRGGGFSGRAGGSGGFHARSSSGGHVAHARPAMPSHQTGAAPRFAGSSVSSRVVIVRPGFRPRPVVHAVPAGFGATAVVVHPAPRPVWSSRPVVPFFGFRHFHRFHHFHGGFGFPFCSPFFGFGFATNHFAIFERELACFPRPFASPFFFPFAPLVGSTVLLLPAPVVSTAGTMSVAQQLEEGTNAENFSVSTESMLPADATETPAPSAKPAPRPITLLQLKDGYMYGLTDYWLEDGRLHYVTTYGGENSVPLDRLDFDTTVRLNDERGVQFVLRSKPSPR